MLLCRLGRRQAVAERTAAAHEPTHELNLLWHALRLNDDPRRTWGQRDWDWTVLIMSGRLSHETANAALAREHAHTQGAALPLQLRSKAQLHERLETLLLGLDFKPVTLRFWNGALPSGCSAPCHTCKRRAT